MLQILLYYW